MEKKEQKKYAWKLLVLVLVIGLLAGLAGGALSAQLFINSGPQGEQGLPGPQGESGPQGQQGIPGENGTNSILQVVQKRNDTQVEVSGYTEMQWHNISDLDPSMTNTMSVQQNSQIFAQFSGSYTLERPSSLWIRIVVDNNRNSSVCTLYVGPSSASGAYKMPGHIQFLTDPLNAGYHTVNVQFMREGTGSTELLDRTLTVIEIASQ